MAVWQWDLWLVPKSEVLNRFSTIPQYVDLDWFESIEWWNNVSAERLKNFFDTLLPRTSNSLDPDVLTWGNDDENTILLIVEENKIRLIIEDGKITDVSLRLDVRNLSQSFLDCLVDFAKQEDFLFFSLESNKFIKPEMSIFLENLQNSRAMLFATNPKQFFEDKNYLNKINKENRRKLE